MAVVVRSFSILGVDGYPVDIETDVISGMPSITIVGMGDTAVREARERLQAAVVNAKYDFPSRKVVINLAPSDIKKSGSNFDLAMAVGLLVKSGQLIVAENIDIKDYAFIGELSLTSQLRPCSEVRGQDSLIKYIQIAAAGGHNMLMIGTPGYGKSMIAKRIPTILPAMTEEEALEVTKIYSVAGELKERGSLIEKRPFRSPHHNASTNSLIGGGNDAKPGEISLAHNGVLFLDEIAEFNKNTLNSLRQPMEDRAVTVSRVRHTHRYPCSFMLVAAMNPCPCGYHGTERCKCTDYEILKYRQKLSGPILDRLDIQKYVSPVNFMDLSGYPGGKSSRELKEQVEFARIVQEKRYFGIEGVNCNAQMNSSLIKEHCSLDSESMRIMEKAYERYKFSARSYYKFLRVARTFADFDGSAVIRRQDVINALMSRDLEKEECGMVVVQH